MQISGKSFLVYGTGISGISAYNFLQKNGANVFLYADKKSNIEGYSTITKFSDVLKIKLDYAVLSPGVSILGNKNVNKLIYNGGLK